MKLSSVLVACNENTRYLDFWPIVKEAWWKVAGLPCIMIYIGESLPTSLQGDPAVKLFKPIPGWPTATQAQCIRLLYPALLGGDGAVMVSDMDMIPLQKDFFVNGFKSFNEHQFVSLRGADEKEKQIYMCYVGATPKVWGEFFGIRNEADVRNRLVEWSQKYPSDGRHGGEGWCSDQIELYTTVMLWQQVFPERIGFVPWTSQIPRLDRGNPDEWYIWNDLLHQNLKTKYYVDFHMPNFRDFEKIIRLVVSFCY